MGAYAVHLHKLDSVQKMYVVTFLSLPLACCVSHRIPMSRTDSDFLPHSCLVTCARSLRHIIDDPLLLQRSTSLDLFKNSFLT